MNTKKFPLIFKVLFSLFILFLVPIYWAKYGPANFLWFSDVALFLTYFGVIFESSLLVSMALIGGLILESLWMLDFILLLFLDVHTTSLTDYMLDPTIPFWLRCLSLFHLFLLPLFTWSVATLGYHRKAWIYQTLLVWVNVTVCYFATSPKANINWVFLSQKIDWITLPPSICLVIQGGLLGGIFYLTHLGIAALNSRREKKPKQGEALQGN